MFYINNDTFEDCGISSIFTVDVDGGGVTPHQLLARIWIFSARDGWPPNLPRAERRLVSLVEMEVK